MPREFKGFGSPVRSQQQRGKTQSGWVQRKFDIFESLVKSDYGDNVFEGCVWLADKRHILDILVPQAESTRFLLAEQEYLNKQALQAGFTKLRLSFVAPEVINGVLEMAGGEG